MHDLTHKNLMIRFLVDLSSRKCYDFIKKNLLYVRSSGVGGGGYTKVPAIASLFLMSGKCKYTYVCRSDRVNKF